MDVQKIKLVYDEFVKEFDLPSFDEIDNCFSVSNALMGPQDLPSNPLKVFAHLVNDYVNNIIGYLHNIVYGAQHSVIIMQDSKNFSDDEKKKVYELMMKVSFISRKHATILFNDDVSRSADYIKFAFEKFSAIRSELDQISNKNFDRWSSFVSQDTNKKDDSDRRGFI